MTLRKITGGHSWALSGMVALLVSCSLEVTETVDRVEGSLVYGDDDRRDLYALESEQLKSLASRSTLAFLPRGSLIRGADGHFELKSESLGELANLCPNEPFAAQATAASCSGVLVDDQLVLTAAHCVPESRVCESGFWAFDYALSSASAAPSFDEDELYRCRSIPLRWRDSAPLGRRWDFAFIELDRPVSRPRRPVELRDRALPSGTPMTVIGHPDGLPTKIDTGGKVIDARTAQHDYFTLTSDTFGGSSGSAVFDVNDLLVGTLVRGGVDYEYREDAACFVVRRIPASTELTDAEHASYVRPAIDCLCASGYQSDRLCRGALGECPLSATASTGSSAPRVTFDGAAPSDGCTTARGSQGFGAKHGTFTAIVALLGLLISRCRSRSGRFGSPNSE